MTALGSMRSCGGAAGRVTILAERHGTPGPKRTVEPRRCCGAALPKAAAQSVTRHNTCPGSDVGRVSCSVTGRRGARTEAAVRRQCALSSMLRVLDGQDAYESRQPQHLMLTTAAVTVNRNLLARSATMDGQFSRWPFRPAGLPPTGPIADRRQGSSHYGRLLNCGHCAVTPDIHPAEAGVLFLNLMRLRRWSNGRSARRFGRAKASRTVDKCPKCRAVYAHCGME